MLNRWKTQILIGFSLVIAAAIPIFTGGYFSVERAQDLESQGEYQAAAQQYAQAARWTFWRTDLIEKAAINFAKAGDFTASVGTFERLNKPSAEGWVWYCTSYIQLQDFPSAISVCNKGAENEKSPVLYGLLAYVYREQGNLSAEQRALEEQTDLNPSDAYAAYRLGMLRMLSTPENAVDELNRASTLNPEVDSAVQTLTFAVAVAETQSDPSMKKVVIGQAFGLVQDWELAQEAFNQAVQLDETNAEAWAWLGEAKQQNGQSGAVELDQALRLDRQSVNVRALRALYWNRQQKFEKMLEEYLLAAQIEPQNPRWQASLGDTYTKLGDLVSALAAHQRAVELAPTDAEYWRLLAVFCAENAVQVEEIGLPAAQQAYTIAPNNPTVLDALGHSYFLTSRFASAEKTLMQAIEIDPGYFPAYIHIALTYLSQGNQPAAYNALTFVRDADESGAYASVANQLLDKYFR